MGGLFWETVAVCNKMPLGDWVGFCGGAGWATFECFLAVRLLPGVVPLQTRTINFVAAERVGELLRIESTNSGDH